MPVRCRSGGAAGSGGAPVLVGSTDASARYSPDTCQDWPSGATTLVLARVPIWQLPIWCAENTVTRLRRMPARAQPLECQTRPHASPPSTAAERVSRSAAP